MLLLAVNTPLVTISCGAIPGCTDAFGYKLQSGWFQRPVTDSMKAGEGGELRLQDTPRHLRVSHSPSASYPGNSSAETFRCS